MKRRRSGAPRILPSMKKRRSSIQSTIQISKGERICNTGALFSLPYFEQNYSSTSAKELFQRKKEELFPFFIFCMDRFFKAASTDKTVAVTVEPRGFYLRNFLFHLL